MKLFKKNVKRSCAKWIGVFLLSASVSLYSCGDNQTQQEQDSNIGDRQENFEVDTTASASRGGTNNSLGRANADTSGTGRQMTNDTMNRK